ncbi:MAG TPA: NAD(P)/FAD-dependent oxidoreductase [Thermomicrobiales bacterium]|nr:NAD(P)/FAD-dependent oxidoreductase [Thermomicrobiales bacterium]
MDGPRAAGTFDDTGAASAPERAGPVIVVGAGLAGLTCAAELTRAGRSVVVLEASDGVGGRVRTDRRDGYLLDRGFQVILDAYPAIRRQVELEGLHPAAFDPGAVVWDGRRRLILADPIRQPRALPNAITSPLFGFQDKLRLVSLAVRARTAAWGSSGDAAGDPDRDVSAADFLWDAGFGRKFVDHFARPFWGGITLDPTLSGSVGPFRYTLKMFIEGRAVLPGDGMQALSDLLASRLRLGTVRYNSPVDDLVRDGERVTGVRVRGEVVHGSMVVVATDPPTARRLTGIEAFPADDQGIGCTTVYLKGRRDPGLGRKLLLDGSGRMSVNHVAPISTVQPTYAPRGRHLLAAVLLGEHAANLDDEAVGRQAQAETARMLSHVPTDWDVLDVVRVPFSQFRQPPGIYGRLPEVESGVPGLVLAGEATVDSSSNGAMLSGEAAARLVLGTTDS